MTAFLFAIAIATWLHHRYRVEQLGGREAFLAGKAVFFDRYISHLHSLPFTLIEWVVFVAILWGLFEGLSWSFAVLVATIGKDTSSTPNGRLL